MTYDRFDALVSLRPGKQYTWSGTNYADIVGTDIPTESEINAELTRLNTEYSNNKYQRDREVSYPPLADLADALYWNSEGDDTKIKAYYAACKKVKADNPKP